MAAEAEDYQLPAVPGGRPGGSRDTMPATGVVLLGKTGVGKSSVAKWMFTGTYCGDDSDSDSDSDDEGEVEGQEADRGWLRALKKQLRKIFKSTKSAEACTQEPQIYDGPFLLDKDLAGEVIDTPGLDDNRGADIDEKHIQNIIKVLKGRKTLDVAAIVQDSNPRVDDTSRKLLCCLQESMPGFERNLVFIVNKWPYDERSVKKSERRRKKKGMGREEEYANEMRKYLQKPKQDGGLGLPYEVASAIRFFFVNVRVEMSDRSQYPYTRREFEKLIRHAVEIRPFDTTGAMAKTMHKDVQQAKDVALAAAKSMADAVRYYNKKWESRITLWKVLKGAARVVTAIGTLGLSEWMGWFK